MERTLSKPDVPKRPRDRDLPGLEDRAIRELEDLAADYADVRDRRMVLTQEEKQRKDTIMAVMHKHRKTHYKRNGVEITLEPGEETVKVRMKPAGEEEPEGDEEPEPKTESADA